jgi:two-component system chemotaxis response regulator CheB
VIGASAGGVETLSRVVAGLPADLAASVCIVLHIAPDSPSALPHILGRAGSLPCRSATDGEPLRRGEILVAPPDHHLVIEDSHVRLTLGPRENGHRPAVDALFRSAAEALKGRVVGVILSGTRDDGSVGLALIKRSGGATIVQDPDDALYPAMPANAIANVEVDAVVPSQLIARKIVEMVSEGDPPPPEQSGNVNEPTKDGEAAVCPECGGVLIERSEAGVPQWRCRVGHRYSTESLVDAQANGVEGALWTAVRALEDRAALLTRMAEHAQAREQARTARRFRRQAQSASDQAETVRRALVAAGQTTLARIGDDELEHSNLEQDVV